MVNMQKKLKVICTVPARLGSTRLPGKALKDIVGLPMIVHTCKRAQLAKTVDDVYLVTDTDEELKRVGEAHGIKVIMTGMPPSNATTSVAKAVENVDCDIVIVLQGDEPLVNPDHIDTITQALIDDPDIEVAIGVTIFNKHNSLSDIKAVLDLEGNVLYCSRTDIPVTNNKGEVKEMLKLCFTVPFRKSTILKYASWSETPLEKIENNHFLRLLEHGIRMRAVKIEGGKISVDTQSDLDEVREMMKEDKLRLKYS
jgi:3-deoxy-manno-octulosonate cytidylyltransferase (CMP-KDO synthetase)